MSDEMKKYMNIVNKTNGSIITELTESVQLDEDLGNLKQVNPKLLRPFQRSYHVGNNRPLEKGYGKQSPVDITTFKSVAKAWSAFKEDSLNKIIIRYNKEQLFLIGQEDGIEILTDSEKISKLDNDVYINFKKIFGHIYDNHTITKAKKMIKLFFDLDKAGDGELDFMIVREDSNREEKSKARKSARQGAVAMMSDSAIKKAFAVKLADKLADLKMDRAQNADDKDDIKALFENSFPKYIKIEGYVYYLEQTRIDIRNMLNYDANAHDYDKSYFTYSMGRKSRDELSKTIEDQIGPYPSGDSDRADYIENRNKMKEKYPANMVNVFIKIVNNKFEIAEIKTDNRYF